MRHLAAGGSAPGRLHVLSDRPNQDAFRLAQGPWGAVAIVCDGCGSEPKSGLGAQLGAALAVRSAVLQIERQGRLDLETLQGDVLRGLAAVSVTGGLDLREHFLFTLLGAAFAGERATVFACGDGVVAIDGSVRELGPFPDNAPPYLGYSFFGEPVALELLYEGPAERVLVGTDGAAGAPLAPFWSDDKYLRNPDLVRRALKLGKPADDATVAVIRRLA